MEGVSLSALREWVAGRWVAVYESWTLIDGLIEAGVGDIVGMSPSTFHKSTNALRGMRNDIKL